MVKILSLEFIFVPHYFNSILENVSFLSMKNNTFLLFASLIIILLLCEVFVRVFFPQINEHDQMFQKDAVLGWEFIPDHSGTILYDGEVNQRIKTNSAGYRDTEFSEKKEAKKILVLGDSFVSNISVKEEQVFTAVLEQRLSNTSVFNLGVNGYGQVQEYLTLQKWLPEIQPDVIVLMVYLRNDFTDNLDTTQWLYPRPTSSLDENGSIVIHPPSESSRLKEESLPFYYASHLFRFVKKRLEVIVSKTDQETPSQFLAPENYVCRYPLSKETQEMYTLLQQMLLEINSFANKNNTPIVFALAPSIAQVENTTWESLEAAAAKDEIMLLRNLPNKILLEFASEHNIHMVDLLPALQAAQKNEVDMYNPREQHWTAAGNKLVATILTNYLNTISY